MKTLVCWLAIIVLVSVHLFACWELLHPHVTPAYRAHFIERTSLDWNPEHYSSTPEQGMSFNRKDLPEWVAYTYGFSIPQDPGRWTDADVADVPGVAFTRTFKGPLCVKFTATPSTALIGKTFAVQIGNESQVLNVIEKGNPEYHAQFTAAAEGDRVSFRLPEKLPRQSEVEHTSSDQRRLGLALVDLRILPGTCPST